MAAVVSGEGLCGGESPSELRASETRPGTFTQIQVHGRVLFTFPRPDLSGLWSRLEQGFFPGTDVLLSPDVLPYLPGGYSSLLPFDVRLAGPASGIRMLTTGPTTLDAATLVNRAVLLLSDPLTLASGGRRGPKHYRARYSELPLRLRERCRRGGSGIGTLVGFWRETMKRPRCALFVMAALGLSALSGTSTKTGEAFAGATR